LSDHPSDPPKAVDLPPVVGIGASAGGLEALTLLVRAIPSESGLAYVIVQHLPPEPRSILTQLLASHTRLPIAEIHDGAIPQPDTIWVAPADSDLDMRGGRLRLRPRKGEIPHLSVDRFFRSLAEEAEANCAAVVLSGAGSDGSAGLRAIKAAGGVTVAQTSDTAAFASMPQSAAATGDVDFVLPPERIARHLRDVFDHRDRGPGNRMSCDDDTLEAALPNLLRILAEHEGHDFSGYKPGTLVRRLRRRLALTQSPSLEAFADTLRQSETERMALIQDFLIGVTCFFRDPGPSAKLEEIALPRVLDIDAPTVRLWVPGCATGEEAYSLAIQLTEAMQARGDKRPLQIFGSDLDSAALRFARRGLYAEGTLQNVSAARRERFFLRRDGQFEVIQPLREAIVFSPHNVLSDPPFSRIQMISCRNLLIYIGQAAQERLLARLHYALLPGGLLHLGPSESISEEGAELFSTLDLRARIFVPRKSSGTYSPLQHGGADPGAALRHRASQANVPIGTVATSTPVRTVRNMRKDFETRLDSHVLGRWSLPYLAVSSDDRVLSYSANAGAMIRPAKGPPSVILDHLIARELLVPARTILAKVRTTGAAASATDLVLSDGGTERLVDLVAEPLPFGDGAALIVLREARLRTTDEVAAARVAPQDATMDTLEQDVVVARRKLVALQADYDSSEQELRSANEELLSMNEELRLSNEELHTSREELQSINEELVTINAELSENNRQLGDANSDLRNIFDSTDIATIFVDRHMRLRRFTCAATSILRMTASDIDRPMASLKWHVDYATLEEDVRELTRTLQPVEREVTDGTRTYMLRIRPYRQSEDHLDGCVLTFFDITERKETERRLRGFVEDAPVSLAMFDRDDVALAASERWQREWALPETVPQVRPANWERLRAAALSGETLEIERQPLAPKDNGTQTRWMRGRIGPWRNVQGEVGGYLLHYENITELAHAEADLRSQAERLELAYVAAGIGAWEWDASTDQSIWSEQMFTLLHASKDLQPSAERFFSFIHPDDRPGVSSTIEKALRETGYYDEKFRVIRGDGQERHFAGIGRVTRNAAGGGHMDDRDQHRRDRAPEGGGAPPAFARRVEPQGQEHAGHDPIHRQLHCAPGPGYPELYQVVSGATGFHCPRT
jgi:two-component system CheB/CheR fusion protein